jgi:hypothetical protein
MMGERFVRYYSLLEGLGIIFLVVIALFVLFSPLESLRRHERGKTLREAGFERECTYRREVGGFRKRDCVWVLQK